MLWFPDKKGQRRLARRRKVCRRRLARLLLGLFVLFGLGAASVAPETALLVRVNRVTGADQFDFVDWESQAVAGELYRRLWPPALPADYAGQRALVDAFLNLEGQIGRLEGEINRVYAAAAEPGREVGRLEAELARLRAEQLQLMPLVETLLARQVEAVLAEEGLAPAGLVLPPVAFRFVDPPTGLVISPRDRIKNEHFIGLQPGLDPGRRAKLEADLDGRGDVSSYITNIGGLGSYPTMVVSYPYLPYVIETIAHEWVHNYFFTFPSNIAWGYQTYPRLITLNETAADVAGKEIARKVFTRFYPDLMDLLPPLDEAGHPAPFQPSEFDLAMRRIRLEVDRLLAEGQISQAEEFMEAERLKLVEKGYYLRKLNQAYFAFHGSYALSPASVDPIGPQMRRLRAASPSLKAFLQAMGWVNSYEDYLDRLREAGVEVVPQG